MTNRSSPELSREETIFAAARALGTPSDREAYLRMACGQDAGLRERIEALLNLESQAEAFFQNRSTAEQAETRHGPEPTPHPKAAPDDNIGKIIGRYKLLEKLGEGGCGVVFVAEQTEPVRRRVALKVIKLGMDTESVIARFEAERQALAMMDHPNIARMLDAGVTGPALDSASPGGSPGQPAANAETRIVPSRPFFVMELVRGIRITDYCDQNNLPTRARLDLFMKVCQAIQHAHQKGIIHRDIKPSNILVTLHDGVPVPKVIDFGIAKATEGRLTDATIYTQLHQFIGTPAYMSPEQAEMSGLDIDTRSDIYSLGVLLYELLTGRTPFEAADLMKSGLEAMRRTIREQEPPRPSTRLATLQGNELTTAARRRSVEAPKLIHQLRGDLDWIAMKSLEKDRTRRYDTANSLALDVQRYLQNETVSAVAPSLTYRFQKFARRNRAALATAATILILLVAGVVISASLALRATRAEHDQRELRELAEKAKANETAERLKVEEKSRQLAESYSQQEQQKLVDVFAKEGSAKGLAHLAAALRRNPDNQRAALRLLSTLSFQNVAKLVSERTFEGRLLDTCNGDLGPLILTANPQGIRLWNFHREAALAGPLPSSESLHRAMFTPSGRLILIALTNATVQVWSTTNLSAPRHTLSCGRLPQNLQFSLDESRLLTVGLAETGDSRRRSFQVWDLRTGAALTQPAQIESGSFSPQFAFTRDASEVIITELLGPQRSGRTRFNVATGTLGARKPMELFFTPDEDQVFGDQTTTPNGVAWTTPLGQSEAFLPLVNTTQRGEYGDQPLVSLRSQYFSPDGRSLLLTLPKDVVTLWDISPRAALAMRIPVAPVDEAGTFLTETLPKQMDLGPGAKHLLTLDHLGTARIWDGQTGHLLIDPLGERGAVAQVRLSRDGSKVAVGETNGWIRLWDTTRGQPLTPRFREANAGATNKEGIALRHLAFNRDATLLAASWGDGSVSVWDALTGKPVTEFQAHQDDVRFSLFSPDPKQLATVGEDGTARVWETSTGKARSPVLRHDDKINGCEFSPDGTRLATASADKSARVWDIRTGQAVLPPLMHDAKVDLVYFLSGGRTLATVTEDRVTRVWDLRDGVAIQTIKPENQASSVVIPADGRFLVTVSYDGLRLWDLSTGTPLSDLLQPVPSPSSLGMGLVSGMMLSTDGLYAALTVGPEVRVWELPRVGGPVPDWLPRLAETLAGQRLNERGLLDSVQPTDFLAVRKAVLASKTEDDYHRWGRWFFSDRSTATLTPFTSTKAEDYARHSAEDKTMGGLQEALALDPSNLRNLEAYADRAHGGLEWCDAPRIGAAFGGNPFVSVESNFVSRDTDQARRAARHQARLALALADRILASVPTSPVAWRLKGLALFHLDEPGPALAALDQADHAQSAGVYWSIRGRILEKLGRQNEAAQAFLQAVDAAKSQSPKRVTTLHAQRARFLKRQNQLAEAAQAACDAMGIPRRDPATRAHCLDLSLHYSSSLRNLGQLWGGSGEGDTFAELPVGLHRLGGIEWDLRGLLNGRSYYGSGPQPAPVNVAVNQRCRALHFLQATANAAFPPNPGGRTGKYTVRYANQETREIPIMIDQHTRDWFFYPDLPLEAAEAPVIWVGTSTRALESSFVRLFDMTWVNPSPDLEIASIDIDLSGGPNMMLTFLVALTADTDASGTQPPPADAAARQVASKTITLNTLEAAVRRRPEHLPYRLAQGQLLDRLDKSEEALDVFSDLIGRAETAGPSGQAIFTLACENRARVLKRLNRSEEAHADTLRGLRISPRSAQTAPHLIDLTRYYNGGLRRTWVGDAFPSLPTGIQKLEGVEFDVRGIIQLAGVQLPKNVSYPDQVAGIAVGRAGSRLHALHATGWPVADGTEIATFVLHYADGQTRSIPVIFGEDVRDWFQRPQQPELAKRAAVAWKGTNPVAGSEGGTIRLFKSTWENPRPGVTIDSLDYVSKTTASAPFLVALTLEPGATHGF